MCLSINYYYSECLCTHHIGWYTCFKAKQYLQLGSHPDEAIDVDDDNAVLTIGGRVNIHDNCERFKHTQQEKKCGGPRCLDCISEKDANGNEESEKKDRDDEASEHGSSERETSEKAEDGSCSQGSGDETSPGGAGVMVKRLKLRKKGAGKGLEISPLKIGNASTNTKDKDKTTKVVEKGTTGAVEGKPLELTKKLVGLKTKLDAETGTGRGEKKLVGLGLTVGVLGKEKSGVVRSPGAGRGDPVKKALPSLIARSSIPVRSSSLVGFSAGSGASSSVGGGGGGAAGIMRPKSRRGMCGDRERETGYESNNEGGALMDDVEKMGVGGRGCAAGRGVGRGQGGGGGRKG